MADNNIDYNDKKNLKNLQHFTHKSKVEVENIRENRCYNIFLQKNIYFALDALIRTTSQFYS